MAGKEWKWKKNGNIKPQKRHITKIQTWIRHNNWLTQTRLRKKKNVGNSARRFFQNNEISTAITEVSKALIQWFYVILQIISCGIAFNIENFRNYCNEIARLYLNLYPWYNIPMCLQKFLIHGSIVVQEAILPVGLISVRAKES